MPRERPAKPEKESGPAYSWDASLPGKPPASLWEYGARPLWVQAAPGLGAVLLLEKTQTALRDAGSGETRWQQPAQALPDEVLADDAGIHLATGRDIRSLDAATGEVRWRATQGGVVTGIASDRDTVYLTTRGPLLALGRADGKPRWKTPCGWEAALHPYQESGLLLVDDAESDTVRCLSAADGTLVWEYEAEGQPVTAGAVVNGIVALSCHGSGLVGVELRTGKEAWRYETGGMFENPAVALGESFLATDGKVHRVDASTGAAKWTRGLSDEEDRFYSALLGGGLVLAETWRGRLLGLNPADGKFRWEHRLGQVHGLAETGGSLVLRAVAPAGDRWSAIALDPETGKPQWALHSPKSVQDLTVVNGVLVVELRNRVLALSAG